MYIRSILLCLFFAWMESTQKSSHFNKLLPCEWRLWSETFQLCVILHPFAIVHKLQLTPRELNVNLHEQNKIVDVHVTCSSKIEFKIHVETGMSDLWRIKIKREKWNNNQTKPDSVSFDFISYSYSRVNKKSSRSTHTHTFEQVN